MGANPDPKESRANSIQSVAVTLLLSVLILGSNEDTQDLLFVAG